MTDLKNGVLYVKEWIPTNTTGVYLFTDAIFNNQNDFNGLGVNALNVNFVLFIPLVEPNSGSLIPGGFGRYKISKIQYISPISISGEVVYDEDGSENGIPCNGQFCLVSELTPNLKLAYPPIDSFYSDLISGGTVAAILNNLVNIVDKISSSAKKKAYKVLSTDWVNGSILVPLNLVINEDTCLEVNGVIYRYGIDNDFTYDSITGNINWLNGFQITVNDNIFIV